MKNVALGFLLALVSFVQFGAAQSAADLAAILEDLTKQVPACALTCLTTEVPKSVCQLTDTDCICHDKPLNDAVLACLSKGCTVIEQLQTLKYQKNLCGAPVRNISTHVTAIVWAFFSAATFCVICRLLGRLPYLGGSFSWDDYTMIACWLVLVPCSAVAQLMVNNGLGQDIWELNKDDITNTLFYFFIEEFLYTFIVAGVKISILLLYLRIFTARIFQIQCYSLMIFIVAFGAACMISTGLYCKPISFVWEGWDGMHPAKCVNINAQTYALAGINMTLDMIIWILPIPQVVALQMSTWKKFAIAGMFAVGLFVTACSIVRLPTVLKWGKSMNPTYDYTNLAVWSLIELDTGIICACLPGMANLCRRLWPRFFGTVKPTSYSNDSGQISDKTHGSGFGRNASPQKINLDTTVSVSYTSKPGAFMDSKSARSDELELTDRHSPTDYKQYGYRDQEYHAQ